MARHLALLRGINVTGKNLIPMVKLAAVCTELGWKDVATYIQSGNVVFTSQAKPAALETALEKAIQHTFKLEIPVVVRSATEWAGYIEGCPFEGEGKFLLLALSKQKPRAGDVSALLEKAQAGERVERVGDALWIYFTGGVARSKLSPAVLDRAVGSSVTARNFNTVLKLERLLRG